MGSEATKPSSGVRAQTATFPSVAPLSISSMDAAGRALVLSRGVEAGLMEAGAWTETNARDRTHLGVTG